MSKQYPQTIYSKIAGVTYSNEDGIERQDIIRAFVRKGMELQLIPEPDNQYSKNALALFVHAKIGIFNKKKPYRVGYIKNDLADRFSKELDTGNRIFVDVTDITGGTKEHKTRGVNIKIKIIQPTK